MSNVRLREYMRPAKRAASTHPNLILLNLFIIFIFIFYLFYFLFYILKKDFGHLKFIMRGPPAKRVVRALKLI